MSKPKTTLSPQLLETLACPQCKGALAYRDAEPQLTCAACKLGFVIRHGVPVLLVDEAIKIQ